MHHRRSPRSSLAVTLSPLITLLAAPLAAQPPGNAAAPARPIVLRAAHLFDGVSGQLVDGGVVVVEGGTITAARRSASSGQSSANGSSRVRHLRGATDSDGSSPDTTYRRAVLRCIPLRSAAMPAAG